MLLLRYDLVTPHWEVVSVSLPLEAGWISVPVLIWCRCDAMWFSRLGHKRRGSFLLALVLGTLNSWNQSCAMRLHVMRTPSSHAQVLCRWFWLGSPAEVMANNQQRLPVMWGGMPLRWHWYQTPSDCNFREVCGARLSYASQLPELEEIRNDCCCLMLLWLGWFVVQDVRIGSTQIKAIKLNASPLIVEKECIFEIKF